MKTLTFGVEIETVGQERDTVARTIAQAIGGHKEPYAPNVVDAQGRVWKVVTDGSLTGSINGEVVTPVLKYDDLDVLLKVVRALAASGARVDQSCSIHYARVSVMRSPRDTSKSGGASTSTNCA